MKITHVFWQVAGIALILVRTLAAQAYQDVAIAYPNGGSNWPIFIAAAGGYYEKYHLNVHLTFSPHPGGIALLVSQHADVINYSLEQMMVAATKSDSLALFSSYLNRGAFALLGTPEIRNLNDLRGRRIGIGQLGDANYGYSAAVLAKGGVSPRDVEWVPLGPSVTARAAALISRRIDAALVTAPAYFSLQNTGPRTLVEFIDRDDIYASNVLVINKSAPLYRDLAARIVMAHAEAIKRFYSDKTFSVSAFLQYQPAEVPGDVGKLYDLYSSHHAFERIPFVLADAVAGTIRQEPDSRIAKDMSTYDFRIAIDTSVVEKLVRDGFFENLFGAKIRGEQARELARAYGH